MSSPRRPGAIARGSSSLSQRASMSPPQKFRAGASSSSLSSKSSSPTAGGSRMTAAQREEMERRLQRVRDLREQRKQRQQSGASSRSNSPKGLKASPKTRSPAGSPGTTAGGASSVSARNRYLESFKNTISNNDVAKGTGYYAHNAATGEGTSESTEPDSEPEVSAVARKVFSDDTDVPLRTDSAGSLQLLNEAKAALERSEQSPPKPEPPAQKKVESPKPATVAEQPSPKANLDAETDAEELIEHLSARLHDMALEVSKYARQEADMQDQVRERDARLISKDATVSELRTLVERLTKQLKDVNEYAAELEELKTLNVKEIDLRQQQLSALNLKVHELQSTTEEKANTSTDLQRQLHTKIAEVDRLKNLVQQLQTDVKLAHSERETSSLRTEHEVINARETNKSLLTEKETLEGKISEQSRIIEELRKQNSEKTRRLESIEDESSRVKIQADEQRRRLEHLESEIESTMNTSQVLDREKRIAADSLERLEKQVDFLRSEAELQSKTQQELRTILDEERDQFMEKLKAQMEKYVQLEMQYSQYRENADRERELAETRYAKLEALHSAQVERNEQLSRDLDSMTQNVDEKVAQIEQLMSKHNTDIATTKEKVESTFNHQLSAEKSALTSLLVEKDDHYNARIHQLREEHEKTCRKLREDNDRLRQQVERTHADLGELESRSNMSVSGLRMEMERTMRERVSTTEADYMRRITSLSDTQIELQAKVKDLEAKLAEEQLRRQQLQTQYEGEVQQTDLLSEELLQLREDLSEAKGEGERDIYERVEIVRREAETERKTLLATLRETQMKLEEAESRMSNESKKAREELERSQVRMDDSFRDREKGLEAEYEHRRKRYEELLLDMQTDRDAMKNRCTQLHSEVSAANTRISELEKEINTMEMNFGRIRDHLLERVDGVLNENAQKMAELMTLNERLMIMNSSKSSSPKSYGERLAGSPIMSPSGRLFSRSEALREHSEEMQALRDRQRNVKWDNITDRESVRKQIRSLFEPDTLRTGSGVRDYLSQKSTGSGGKFTGGMSGMSGISGSGVSGISGSGVSGGGSRGVDVPMRMAPSMPSGGRESISSVHSRGDSSYHRPYTSSYSSSLANNMLYQPSASSRLSIASGSGRTVHFSPETSASYRQSRY